MGRSGRFKKRRRNKEDFEFPIHTDNDLGPNPNGAKMGLFKTITCCWVLDDFTNENAEIIDGIRQQIELWKNNKEINLNKYFTTKDLVIPKSIPVKPIINLFIYI